MSELWHHKNLELFRGLSEADAAAMERTLEIVALRKNQLAPLRDGEERGLFVVLQGHVRLTYTDARGAEAVVVVLGPGDFFGSLEDDGSDYGAHCRALTNARLGRLSAAEFDALVKKSPHLALKLTKMSMSRVQRLQVRLAEMMLRTVSERLALTLLGLAEQVGREEAGGKVRLMLWLTQSDLGKLIGSSREMVCKVMKEFQSAGLVDVDKGWINLVSLDGLRERAGNRPTGTGA
jgi:CRP-like cAMP-binding protein